MRSKWAAGKAVRAGLALEGAYLNRYVTDEQRGRRPIFIATLWAGASWLFFRVARSTRMTQIWALRSRLEKQPTDLRQYTSYFGDRTLAQFRVGCRTEILRLEHLPNLDLGLLAGHGIGTALAPFNRLPQR